MAAEAGVEIVRDPKRISRHVASRGFLQATLDRGSMEAADVYRLALDEFLDLIADKTYADEVRRTAISKFHVALKKRNGAEDGAQSALERAGVSAEPRCERERGLRQSTQV